MAETTQTPEGQAEGTLALRGEGAPCPLWALTLQCLERLVPRACQWPEQLTRDFKGGGESGSPEAQKLKGAVARGAATQTEQV